MSSLFVMLLLIGCGEPEDTPLDTGEAPPMEPLFSFAVIADPHLGNSDAEERLERAVGWVEERTGEGEIELVLLLGDWGSMDTGRDLLNALSVPWVPIIGDNDIPTYEEYFGTVFADELAVLESTFDNWSLAATPVQNPEIDAESWLWNYSFDHRGVHFANLDFCSRIAGEISGEMADLHNFDGGSWPWFVQDMESLDLSAEESVIISSHQSLFQFPGAFDDEEFATIEAFLSPYADYVYASFGGHFHFDYYETLDAGYEILMVDATWDDEVRVWRVDVQSNGHRFEYSYESVVVE